MNVNSAYKFNVRNIKFVLMYINYMPIFGNFYIPRRLQGSCYCKFSNTRQSNALLHMNPVVKY